MIFNPVVQPSGGLVTGTIQSAAKYSTTVKT